MCLCLCFLSARLDILVHRLLTTPDETNQDPAHLVEVGNHITKRGAASKRSGRAVQSVYLYGYITDHPEQRPTKAIVVDCNAYG
jgi:exoribonuclease R